MHKIKALEPFISRDTARNLSKVAYISTNARVVVTDGHRLHSIPFEGGEEDCGIPAFDALWARAKSRPLSVEVFNTVGSPLRDYPDVCAVVPSSLDDYQRLGLPMAEAREIRRVLGASFTRKGTPRHLTLHTNGVSYTLGDAKGIVSQRGYGEALATVGIRYFAEALRLFDGPVDVWIKDAYSPIVIVPMDGDLTGEYHLLMPMNVDPLAPPRYRLDVPKTFAPQEDLRTGDLTVGDYTVVLPDDYTAIVPGYDTGVTFHTRALRDRFARLALYGLHMGTSIPEEIATYLATGLY